MKMPLTNMAENIPRNVTSDFDFSLQTYIISDLYLYM